MIIESIDLRGFGPVKRFDQRFRHENCIVGPNGGGKTMLLSVLAGVCGNDRATMLVEGQPVEHCTIVASENGESFIFEAKGTFDADQIAEFKEKLPKRVNFAVTEWSQTFPSHCVDPATARNNFRLYCERHGAFRGRNEGPVRDFVYRPSSRSASFIAGDGYRFAMSLFVNDSDAGAPVLYDNPSRHMDLHGKRLMTEMLCRDDRQLFFTTHCPEMVLHDAWQGRNPDQLVVDIPQSPQKNR